MRDKIFNYLGYFIFIGVAIVISLIVSKNINIDIQFKHLNIGINQKYITGVSLGNFSLLSGNNYKFTIEEKSNNSSSDRASFLGILSTLLATFFVYSSWKIDNDLRSISNTKDIINKIKDDIEDESNFSNQLKYAIQYMMSKQYDKAIDGLVVLRSESSTLKNDNNLNSCYYFLAVCRYEKYNIENDIEHIAKSLQYIDQAIADDNHPLKIEISSKFQEAEAKLLEENQTS